MAARRSRRTIAVGAAGAAAVTLLVMAGRDDRVRGPVERPAAAAASAQPATGLASTVALPSGGPPSPPASAATAAPEPRAAADARFADHLRERFGATLDHPHTQVKALESLIAYLQRFHGGDWRAYADRLLAMAFPERAAEMLALLDRLERYDERLEARRAELAALPPKERRAALAALRDEIFGADAERIFEAELRNARLADALEAIDSVPALGLEARLDAWVAAVRDEYGDRADGFIAARGTELMTRFLSLGAVQDDLHALPPVERDRALEDVRRAVGLDDAALERWRALDAERDTAWEVGERYMAERAAILAAPESPARAQALAALQARMFGAEADAIRSEEEAGFYRFAGRRRIGRE